MPTITAGEARDRAFERLYSRYVQDVYRYTLALLRNPADAEDVTQTTFMNAYRAWSRGERVEKPQNWLIRIAHNAARTKYARSLRRVPEVPLDEALNEIVVAEEERPDVEEVLSALGELPFNQRAALVMRELEGRSYAEIAQTLEVSQSAVEALIFRARRSLRLSSRALRGLLFVPLPSSLSSFFDGTGALGAGGGALAGSGILLKAATVVAVGAVAAGAAFKSLGPAGSTAALPAAAGQAVRAQQPAARSAVARARIAVGMTAASRPAPARAANHPGAHGSSPASVGPATPASAGSATPPAATGRLAAPGAAQQAAAGGAGPGPSSPIAAVASAPATLTAATAAAAASVPSTSAAAVPSTPSAPAVQTPAVSLSAPSTPPLTPPKLP